MKELLRDFITLFGNCLLVLSLMLSSYLLLINLYHYREVNYVYNTDIALNVEYNNMKSKVEKIEKNLSKINVDLINNNREQMLLRVTQGQIKKCLSDIKESKIYTPQLSYDIHDLYVINDELNSNVGTQCLFMIDYYITTSIDKYGVSGSDYEEVHNKVTNKMEVIENYTGFLKNDMLKNSSYNYATINTKEAIFNNLAENLSINIYNYNNMLDSVEEMTKWFVERSGGRYE